MVNYKEIVSLSLDNISSSNIPPFSEYPDDIHPYATFNLQDRGYETGDRHRSGGPMQQMGSPETSQPTLPLLTPGGVGDRGRTLNTHGIMASAAAGSSLVHGGASGAALTAGTGAVNVGRLIDLPSRGSSQITGPPGNNLVSLAGATIRGVILRTKRLNVAG